MPNRGSGGNSARGNRGRSATELNRGAAIRRREERISFLILCEGKTEKSYFTGMRSRNGPQLDVDWPDVDHVAIVREAVQRAADADRCGAPYSEVWCVLDTELDEALVQSILAAADSDVRIALSCPSFETWLLLHKIDHRRPFQSADEAKRKLREVHPGWAEGRTQFTDFAPGLHHAVDRARRLDSSGTAHLTNPSSSVWKLVEAIQQAHRDIAFT
ncbi:RloB family protein [Nocardia nova]|uniref:RloB family protein n=1 Tax=Nocardia nova TaxID=37330 RepID=UPI002738EB7E|nr:RloB family protein [Nocardia nova]